MTERRIPIVATVVVAAAIATMIGLGIWQLDRLDQKEAMIARFEAAAQNPQILSAFPADPQANLYRRTPYDCAAVSEWNAIAGRNDRDMSGYIHIASCTAVDGGQPAEVVIGWSRGPEQPGWQGGAVTGTIAPGGEAGWRIVADPPQAGLEANAAPDPASTPNNHLAYAGQWFLFALSALVIYVLALRRRWR